jgi:hypothetical protein
VCAIPVSPRVKQSTPTRWQRFELSTWEAGPDGQVVERTGPIFVTVTSDESRLVDAILQLSQRGLLKKVRPCDRTRCGWWFYQRLRHQHFCNEQCDELNRRSKAFKAKHAEAQKENDRKQPRAFHPAPVFSDLTVHNSPRPIDLAMMRNPVQQHEMD